MAESFGRILITGGAGDFALAGDHGTWTELGFVLRRSVGDTIVDGRAVVLTKDCHYDIRRIQGLGLR